MVSNHLEAQLVAGPKQVIEETQRLRGTLLSTATWAVLVKAIRVSCLVEEDKSLLLHLTFQVKVNLPLKEDVARERWKKNALDKRPKKLNTKEKPNERPRKNVTESPKNKNGRKKLVAQESKKDNEFWSKNASGRSKSVDGRRRKKLVKESRRWILLDPI
jgi:hypothetical protein